MAAGDVRISPGYNWIESAEVITNGTTSVTAFKIPKGTVVEHALLISKVAGTGAANITVGDAADPDGFIEAADHTSAAGTVFGDAIAELGVYLKKATGATSGFAIAPTYYAADASCLVALSAAGTTQGTWIIVLKGYRITPHA